MDIETLLSSLDASESTVRRDLIELESNGVLRRVHGGAISLQSRDSTLDYAFMSTRMIEEKARIGKAVAALVEDGQTVMLDGGSTSAEVARNLLSRSIQVITNSIAIAEVFYNSKNVEVTLTGGYLYPRIGVLLGPLCEQMLSAVAADVLIMGIGGITKDGLSNSNTLIVGSEKKMMEVSRVVIIAADHTKFGRKAMTHLAPLEAADLIVTDKELAPEHQDLLRNHGIEFILA